MSKSSSGFWLHLDQPQRLSLQGVGVCHLEKLCLFGIAGHHTAVPAACSQVSQQCSKALHRQITGRFVCFLLEVRRLRSLGRRHGVAPPPILGQVLVLEQERFPHLPQVPLYAVNPGCNAFLTFPTKVPSDSLGGIGSLKRTSDKSLFPMALGSCRHRITHQLRPINMNMRSILSVTSFLICFAIKICFFVARKTLGGPGGTSCFFRG